MGNQTSGGIRNFNWWVPNILRNLTPFKIIEFLIDVPKIDGLVGFPRKIDGLGQTYEPMLTPPLERCTLSKLTDSVYIQALEKQNGIYFGVWNFLASHQGSPNSGIISNQKIVRKALWFSSNINKKIHNFGRLGKWTFFRTEIRKLKMPRNR